MLGKIVDGFISAFNPQAGLRRAQARRVLRAYTGAEPSRLTANRKPKNNSADTELGGAFGANQMRAWARMLVRDNAWAWGVVDTFVNSVVGKGIDIQSAVETVEGSDVEAINERRDEVWQRWCEVCEINGQYTFAEIQQMAMREIVEAGEVLIRMVPVDTKYRGILRPVPMALELIEPDRLAEEKDTHRLPRNENHRINRGVELDELGRAVAYWIYPNHPTDPYTLRGDPVRVDSSEVIHLYNRQRIGQTRGISMFAPVVAWLRDLGLYVENELQASAVASCFTVAIKTENAVAGFAPPSSAAGATSDVDGNRYEYLQPGMVMHLNPNESIESANPGRPNSASEPWIKLMLRGIAVGTGLSYETVARDYSQTNYSSNRASQLEDRRRFRRWQQYFINRLNQRVWDQFIKAAALADIAGFPTMTDLLNNPRKAAPCEHLPPSWEWVDPQAEQQSSEAGIKAFQTTYLDELAGRGKNWRQVFYQRAKEERLLKQLGLVSPTAISASDATTTAPAQADAAVGSDGQTASVQDEALNGAQVTSLVDVITQVATGAMPKDTAKAVLASAFPGFDPARIASIVDPIVPGSVTADGKAQPNAANNGSGEMMGLSRLQWQRNRKAIMDVLKDFISGAVSETQAKVLLGGLGLSIDNVTALLADAADGTVDSVPAEEGSQVVEA
jgi:lambda family phage portal protein